MKYKQFEKGTGVLRDMGAQCSEDSERWFGDVGTNNIVHHTLGMCGEVGEFANLVKKVDRGSLNLGDASTRVKLAEELTDTFVYMLNIAHLLGVDLEKSYVSVRAQNEKRFMEARRQRESK
jgi:NTP pyrophosphatase (non-canonical NTP hydrolase)